MKFPEDSDFICIDSWNKALYEQALQWVDEKRRVAMLSTEERSSSDPRVKIYSLESPLQRPLLARKIAWQAVFQKLWVMGSSEFAEELRECHLAAELILSEAADYWLEAMKNAKANLSPYRRGMELKGAFEGIPAIVIGAGPSLEKNRHLLKAFENKGLLFAGGTALNAIDVEPHFAASIDANAPYHQFKAHSFFQTPFCYQARMNRENFSLLHGEKLLFPDSSSDAINWMYKEERFDGGWTVGNFLTAIAVHMGCSPILFVGMDLCYAEGRKYAQVSAQLPDGLIEARGCLTQRDWLMSARWTEAFGKRGDFIDCTEEGLLELPKQSLETLSFPERPNLRRQVHEAIQALDLVTPSFQWDKEAVYEKLLLPLWAIWSPVFEREGQSIEIHKKLFFQRVLEEYGELIL